MSAWMAHNIDSNLFEVVFIKHTDKYQVMGWENAVQANTVSRWMDNAVDGKVQIQSNTYTQSHTEITSALKVWHSKLGPDKCFDKEHYMAKNSDIVKPLQSCTAAFSPNPCFLHFVVFGDIEGRKGSFKCHIHSPRHLNSYVLSDRVANQTAT